jgi:hypothetical protein
LLSLAFFFAFLINCAKEVGAIGTCGNFATAEVATLLLALPLLAPSASSTLFSLALFLTFLALILVSGGGIGTCGNWATAEAATLASTGSATSGSQFISITFVLPWRRQFHLSSRVNCHMQQFRRIYLLLLNLIG